MSYTVRFEPFSSCRELQNTIRANFRIFLSASWHQGLERMTAPPYPAFHRNQSPNNVDAYSNACYADLIAPIRFPFLPISPRSCCISPLSSAISLHSRFSGPSSRCSPASLQHVIAARLESLNPRYFGCLDY
jgi:hypothetical protein